MKAHQPKSTYWKSFLGIPYFKVDWYAKYYIYKLFGYTFSKLRDQKHYWNTRGVEYYDEILFSDYLKYEVFFQDMLVDELRTLSFASCFEAGCGFGWNIKRVRQEFPEVRIGGLDISFPQVLNSRRYLPDIPLPAVQGNACALPFADRSFDVGFSLGSFMHIHSAHIGTAIDEMMRVSGKYIFHIEWDQENTSPRLRDKRIFKTNIISHDYKRLYQERGASVEKFETYLDFKDAFFERFPTSQVKTWQPYEGPEKFIFILVRV